MYQFLIKKNTIIFLNQTPISFYLRCLWIRNKKKKKIFSIFVKYKLNVRKGMV